MNSSAVSKDTASVPDIYPRDLIRMTDSLLRGELRDPHLGSGHPFRSIAVAEDMTEQLLEPCTGSRIAAPQQVEMVSIPVHIVSDERCAGILDGGPRWDDDTDSDKLRLGEWVLAIGSPLGEQLRSTITAGIVSAKGRSMPNYDGEFKIESFIQTDAAVNPGNSGGALVNKTGELVGINTAIVSTTGSYTGYSFAVPSNIVKKVVSDLIDFGSVKRATLGVTMTGIDEKTAKDLKLDSLDGVLIHEVLPGGAAQKAGVKEGDILLAVDSTVIKTPSGLQEKVNSFHPGDKAVLKVLRDGKTLELKVTFQEGTDEIGSVEDDGTVMFYGAKLGPAERGVEIIDAGNGRLAEAGGVDGFIILYVNDQKVNKPEDVIELAKKSKRSIFIEGVTSTGRPGYFGFGKDD